MPNRRSDLFTTDRRGIEIDYCPEFRGVWLDRGELDKTIENSTALTAQLPTSTPRTAPAVPTHQPQHQYGHDQRYQPRQKKTKPFLGGISDF
ncbi:zf-TFIIB domain-containing protein [Rhodospirillaceae bacterium SYSU D60014]|uniref:TFIIB-type zinc ribbon-containing protein n=1 Tax=Virgifigura deserti TaxID=2268457 RepID=UPI000E673621